MVALASRLTSRPVILPLVLAIALGFGFTAGQRDAQPARAQDADRIAVVLRWLDAEQRSDLDTALAQFGPNVTFIGTRATGNCSIATPCTDAAGLRQQIQGNIAIHPCTEIRSIQVSGSVVTGVRENHTDSTRANGVDHTVQAFIAVVPQDKITFFVGVQDLTDSATALNAAINAGTQAAGTPIPLPSTPCPPLV